MKENEKSVQFLFAAAPVKVGAAGVQQYADEPDTKVGMEGIQR